MGRKSGIPTRGSDVEISVRLPISAAVTGAEPTLEVPSAQRCPDCRGTGALHGTALEKCPECDGRGQVRRSQSRGFSRLITILECPMCHGTGQRIREPCPTCDATGILRRVKKLKVQVPPGIEDGAVLRLAHQGVPADGSGPTGDLFVQVLLEPAPSIHREGQDAYTETHVSLSLALFGGQTRVNTITGQAMLTVLRGPSPRPGSGRREGFPRLRSSERGDLIVTVHVDLPESISPHQRELLREALGAPNVKETPTSRRGGLFRRRSERPVAEEWESPPETEHYFSERPKVASQRRESLDFLYRGTRRTFVVDRGVFASTSIDPGTSLLIETLDPAPDSDHILDLGCGWGAIGIAASGRPRKGTSLLTDVNRRAALLARANLRRNRIENAEVKIGSGFVPVAAETFDLIATNPPYHAGGLASSLSLLEEAPRHLAPTGRLLLVGKGSQGIRFYQRWLSEHWAPGVEVRARGGGYRVLEARASGTTSGPGVVREANPSDSPGETLAFPTLGAEALKWASHLGARALPYRKARPRGPFRCEGPKQPEGDGAPKNPPSAEEAKAAAAPPGPQADEKGGRKEKGPQGERGEGGQGSQGRRGEGEGEIR